MMEIASFGEFLTFAGIIGVALAISTLLTGGVNNVPR